MIKHKYYFKGELTVYNNELNEYRERIYRVTFNSYTNSSHNTVSLRFLADDGIDYDYIHLAEDGSLLIRESQFDLIKDYGQGIKTMEFVGHLFQSHRENSTK